MSQDTDRTITVRGHEFTVNSRTINSGDNGEYTYLRTKVTIGRDPDTNRLKQADITGRNIDELKANIDNLLHYTNADAGLIGTEMTVEDWISEGRKYRNSALEISTILSEQTKIRKYILPSLGRFGLQDITEDILIRWQESMLTDGCSENSVSYTLYVLSRYLQLAVRHRYLAYNPCSFCAITGRSRGSRKALDESILDTVLNTRPLHKYSIVAGITLLCALRISETLGLRWDDFNLSQRTLTVHQQVARSSIADSSLIIKPYTKNKSNRTICIPAAVLWYLKAQHEMQEKLQRLNASYRNINNLVFTDENGGIVSKAAVGYWFDQMTTDIDPSARVHDLRRTCVTRAVELTSDAVSAQHYLGHAYTVGTYEYLEEGERSSIRVASAMNPLLEAMLREAGGIS